MSGEVVTFVSQRKLGSASRKAVIVQFAETANGQGKGIWKSHGTIASLSEVSTRTVQRIIKDFVDEGLVLHVGYHTRNGVTTKAYDLDLDAIGKLPLVQSDSGFSPVQRVVIEPEIESGQNGRCDTDDKKPAKSDTKNCTGVTLTALTVLTAPIESERVKEVIGLTFEHWNAMAKASGLSLVRTNVFNRRRSDLIIKRLKDCGNDFDLIRQAISNVPNNPHWLGENNRGWKADFDWVFNPSNFTRVLEYAQPTHTQKAKHDRNNNSQSTSRYRKSDELDAATRLALEELGGG